jgi:hypothetical protein
LSENNKKLLPPKPETYRPYTLKYQQNLLCSLINLETDFDDISVRFLNLAQQITTIENNLFPLNRIVIILKKLKKIYGLNSIIFICSCNFFIYIYFPLFVRAVWKYWDTKYC